MAPRNQRSNNNRRPARSSAPMSPFARQQQELEGAEVAPRTTYGPPFVVMEDKDKKTFVFNGSSWVPHSMSIAECRRTCQVKELSKMKDKTRFEVREPLA